MRKLVTVDLESNSFVQLLYKECMGRCGHGAGRREKRHGQAKAKNEKVAPADCTIVATAATAGVVHRNYSDLMQNTWR